MPSEAREHKGRTVFTGFGERYTETRGSWYYDGPSVCLAKTKTCMHACRKAEKQDKKKKKGLKEVRGILLVQSWQKLSRILSNEPALEVS